MALRHSNGGLTKSQRPLRMLSIRTGPLISKVQEDQTIFKLTTPTPNGSNSSDMNHKTLSTLKTTKFLISKEEEMLKDNLFGYGRDTTVPIKDGM
jgi:hypothetical protein